MSAPSYSSDSRHYLGMAARHYENFPVGSWLLPARARRHLHRIYAFARTADDLADELRDGPALAAFRADFLRQVGSGGGEGGGGERAVRDGGEGGGGERAVRGGGERAVPLFVDLAASIRECGLEVALFTDLLDAFAQDCVKTRYNRAELLAYCRRSADPVGRLVLRVCGHRDARLDAWSDAICTGLQLLNHLQDLGEDLRLRDRIYFPSEDLARFGVDEPALRASSATPAVRAFVLHEANQVAAMFVAGWPLVDAVRGRLRLELRAILRGAAAVLARIRRAGGDVLGGRVHLTRMERIGTAWMGLCSRRAPRFVEAGA